MDSASSHQLTPSGTLANIITGLVKGNKDKKVEIGESGLSTMKDTNTIETVRGREIIQDSPELLAS